MITSRAMQRHEKVADRAGSLVTEGVRALIETAQSRADRVQRNAADEAHRLDSQRMHAASRIVSQIGELEGTLGRLREQMQSEHAVEGSYVEEGRLIEAVQEREVDAPAGPTASTGPSATVTEPVEEAPAPAGTAPAEEQQDPSAEEVEELAAEVQDLADEVKELKAEVLERTAEVEELGSRPEEASVEPEAPEPEPEPEEVAPEPEPQAAEPEEPAAIGEDVPVPAAEEASAGTAPAPATEESEASEAGNAAQRKRFSFRRRKEAREEAGGPAAIGEPEAIVEQATHEAYACGVCGRGFAGNEDELKSLGWVVSESGGVTCADCHSAGWLRPGT